MCLPGSSRHIPPATEERKTQPEHGCVSTRVERPAVTSPEEQMNGQTPDALENKKGTKRGSLVLERGENENESIVSEEKREEYCIRGKEIKFKRVYLHLYSTLSH